MPKERPSPSLHDSRLFRAKALQFRSNPLEGATGFRIRPRTLLILTLANLTAVAIVVLVALMPVTIIVERADAARYTLRHATVRPSGAECAPAPGEPCPRQVEIHFRHLYLALLR